MTFVERDCLSFLQILVTNAFQIAHVEEDVISRASVNETKPFFRQLLDRTFSHSSTFFKSETTNRLHPTCRAQ